MNIIYYDFRLILIKHYHIFVQIISPFETFKTVISIKFNIIYLLLRFHQSIILLKILDQCETILIN